MTINSPGRMRFKVFTSFALAALGLIALVRLFSIAPPSHTTIAAYAILVVLVGASAWRGLIYLRAVLHAPVSRP
ncbi:MAG TPA: hypothetical protein VFF60_09330 [Candidatus Binatus sp.]|nr:hypothetical protein [Candidatus Binatus sp.]